MTEQNQQNFEEEVEKGRRNIEEIIRDNAPVGDDKQETPTPTPTGEDTSKNDEDEDIQAKINDESSPEKEPKTESDGQETSTPTPTPTPTPIVPSDGTSHAYVPNARTDIYGNIKQEEPKPKEKKAPREKTKVSDVKGENMMDIIWNEIMGAYNSTVDWITDNVIGFTDFVFFADDGPEREKKQKTNVYAVGQKMRNENQKDWLKREEYGKKAYAEFLENLENDANSRPVKWNILKTEPSFFKEISEIYKKNPAERSEKDNELIEQIKNPPLDKIIEQERNIMSQAINVATSEVAAQKQRGDILFEGSAKTMEALEEAIKNGNKEAAEVFVDVLIAGVPQNGEMYQNIRLSLMNVRDSILRGDDPKVTGKAFKELEEQQEAIKENPELWASKVATGAEVYQEIIRNRIIGIKEQDKYTVSADFNEQLKKLNEIFKDDSTLTSEAKKNSATAVIDLMVAGLKDTEPGHKEIKQSLTQFKEKLGDKDITTMSAEAINALANGYISNITEINKANDPKDAEIALYLENIGKSVQAVHAATKNCSSVLNVLHKKENISALDEAVNQMKSNVVGDETSPQPTNTRKMPYEIVQYFTRQQGR